jgi:hypothetical protein
MVTYFLKFKEYSRKYTKHFVNLFTFLKKMKECVGFFFFNNLIATNGGLKAQMIHFKTKIYEKHRRSK